MVKSLYERRVCAFTTTQHMARQDEPRHIVLEELIRESLMEINDRLLVNVVYVPGTGLNICINSTSFNSCSLEYGGYINYWIFGEIFQEEFYKS